MFDQCIWHAKQEPIMATAKIRKALVAMLILGISTAVSADINRHQFTRGITDREPVDRLTTASNITPLYYFTELVDMTGSQVTHRWRYKGQIMASIQFQIEGPRWRVYSSKELLPGWSGLRSVEVLDQNGRVIIRDNISVLIDR
jgi:hypothetical protein